MGKFFEVEMRARSFICKWKGKILEVIWKEKPEIPKLRQAKGVESLHRLFGAASKVFT